MLSQRSWRVGTDRHVADVYLQSFGMPRKILRNLSQSPARTVHRESDARTCPWARVEGDSSRTFAGDGMTRNASSEDVFLSFRPRGHQKDKKKYHNDVQLHSTVHLVTLGTSLFHSRPTDYQIQQRLRCLKTELKRTRKMNVSGLEVTDWLALAGKPKWAGSKWTSTVSH